MATIGDNPQNAAALDGVKKNMENQTDHGDVTTNKKPRRKRFPFPKVLPITFKPSPERLAEVERFRRTLQSPTIDIPVLVEQTGRCVACFRNLYCSGKRGWSGITEVSNTFSCQFWCQIF